MAAEAPERSPLRLAGRIAAALIGVAFVALLAYGLVTKSPDRTVDDGLRKSGSVAAPGPEPAGARARGSRRAAQAPGGTRARRPARVARAAARHAGGAQLLGLVVRPLPGRGAGAPARVVAGNARAACSSSD